mmetsp:Transcript_96584/g.243444  ORF Transcript_96584/g.243444 Transcript_96584/m.243444 type:complete len:229 (+) Transcript_96584:1801-2487(+)
MPSGVGAEADPGQGGGQRLDQQMGSSRKAGRVLGRRVLHARRGGADGSEFVHGGLQGCQGPDLYKERDQLARRELVRQARPLRHRPIPRLRAGAPDERAQGCGRGAVLGLRGHADLRRGGSIGGRGVRLRQVVVGWPRRRGRGLRESVLPGLRGHGEVGARRGGQEVQVEEGQADGDHHQHRLVAPARRFRRGRVLQRGLPAVHGSLRVAAAPRPRRRIGGGAGACAS